MFLTKKYQNPLTSFPSADPFVLKHAGEYWAYVTGEWQDGRYFGILHSKDMLHWEARSGALAPLQPPPGEQYTCYWAPEVTYENGVFYLYYSVGDEKHMHIRAATSQEPGGPFIDSGHRLTSEQFAIDAHVFTDDDGARYMFYAADFLDHTHIGTGIVVDRLLDAFHLAGSPKPAARARYDWQVYDPNRAEKGGVRWHTVEGPFVLKRKGRYYLMFSGGNWQNDSYGLGYAVSDQVESDQEWEQPCDGDRLPQILKSNQAQGVIGPGHNSVVQGPDHWQLYCVYHRWNQDVGARVMAVDRLEWIGDRLAVLGPTTGQEIVNAPEQMQGNAFQGKQVISLQQDPQAFAVELTVQAASDAETFRLYLRSSQAELLVLAIQNKDQEIQIHTPYADTTSPLPVEFRMEVKHLLRVEINGRLASVSLPDAHFNWIGLIQEPPEEIGLISDTGGEYSGFAISPGWQDTFEQPFPLANFNWADDSGQGAWQAGGGLLQQTDPAAGQARIMKDLGFASQAYEVVVNVRMLDRSASQGHYTCYPAAAANAVGPAFFVLKVNSHWELIVQSNSGRESVQLPAGFDPYQYQQFRFRVGPHQVKASLEQNGLLTTAFAGKPTRVGLGSTRSSTAFDLIRVVPITNFAEER